MTIGRVGRADARPADVTGGRVRVDRGHSPLGNPFVLGGEEDREAACEAYDLLLAEALELPSARGVMGWSAAAIGAARGFTGEVGGGIGRRRPMRCGACASSRAAGACAWTVTVARGGATPRACALV